MKEYMDIYGNTYGESDRFFSKEEIKIRVKMGDLFIINKKDEHK